MRPRYETLDADVRALRECGTLIRDIAERLGVSRATVWRICKRLSLPRPRIEHRGRWRVGKKGATPAQILAHAKPENAVTLLQRYGYDETGRSLRELQITEEKKRAWGMAS